MTVFYLLCLVLFGICTAGSLEVVRDPATGFTRLWRLFWPVAFGGMSIWSLVLLVGA